MPTTAADVVDVLDALAAVGVDARLQGGWGVDALVGRQSREHRDLDLAVDAGHLPPALAALDRLGYTVSTDWLPVRVEVSAGDRHIDLHPLHYAPDGSAWQAGPEGTPFAYAADAWAAGTVGSRPVRCLTAVVQRAFHLGYVPRAVDRHDLALLAALDRS